MGSLLSCSCQLPLYVLGPYLGYVLVGQVAAHASAVELLGNTDHSPGPNKRVKHNIPFSAAGQDARLDQLAGKGGEVGHRHSFSWNRPDGAFISLINMTLGCFCKRLVIFRSISSSRDSVMSSAFSDPTSRNFDSFGTTTFTPGICVEAGWLPYRISIIEIPRTLGEQKQVLMALGGPVSDRLRHWVGLAPDNVRAKPLAVGLEGKSYAPGDAYEVFVFQTFLW